MEKYLIGYVSRTGTTKEIAERISAKLTENKIMSDILPLPEIVNLDSYKGVILGSPINGMKVLPDFHTFIQSNPGLKGKTLGVFTVSYIFENGRKMWKKMINKDQAIISLQLEPRTMIITGGRLDKPLPGFANALFGLSKGLPSDTRNWNQIDEWINKLVKNILEDK